MGSGCAGVVGVTKGVSGSVVGGGSGVDAALENAVLEEFSSAGWFKGWPSGSKALSR